MVLLLKKISLTKTALLLVVFLFIGREMQAAVMQDKPKKSIKKATKKSLKKTVADISPSTVLTQSLNTNHQHIQKDKQRQELKQKSKLKHKVLQGLIATGVVIASGMVIYNVFFKKPSSKSIVSSKNQNISVPANQTTTHAQTIQNIMDQGGSEESVQANLLGALFNRVREALKNRNTPEVVVQRPLVEKVTQNSATIAHTSQKSFVEKTLAWCIHNPYTAVFSSVSVAVFFAVSYYQGLDESARNMGTAVAGTMLLNQLNTPSAIENKHVDPRVSSLIKGFFGYMGLSLSKQIDVWSVVNKSEGLKNYLKDRKAFTAANKDSAGGNDNPGDRKKPRYALNHFLADILLGKGIAWIQAKFKEWINSSLIISPLAWIASKVFGDGDNVSYAMMNMLIASFCSFIASVFLSLYAKHKEKENQKTLQEEAKIKEKEMQEQKQRELIYQQEKKRQEIESNTLLNFANKHLSTQVRAWIGGILVRVGVYIQTVFPHHKKEKSMLEKFNDGRLHAIWSSLMKP